MSTLYPGALDNSTSLPYPGATNNTNSPSLAGGQDNQNDAIIAAESKLGINASTPTATTVLLGAGAGSSSWGNITPSYMNAVTGTGAFVCATSPTISSPTINTPTINNPTLKTDSVIGYTSANTGTVYGMSVASGILASAALTNTVNTAAIQNNAITFATLASTIFSGQINTYTTTGISGAGNYINLGGMKIAWGITASQNISTAAYNISMPSSFFSSTPTFAIAVAFNPAASTDVVVATGISSTNLSIFVGTSAVQQVTWLVIGT